MVIETWIDHLAAQDYAAAFAATDHDAYYGWTPALMRRVIEGYGLPEARPSGVAFHVTARADATGRPRYREITEVDEAGDVLMRATHDLPLNGRWSDLTATFRVEKRLGRPAALILEEIHVF